MKSDKNISSGNSFFAVSNKLQTMLAILLRHMNKFRSNIYLLLLRQTSFPIWTRFVRLMFVQTKVAAVFVVTMRWDEV